MLATWRANPCPGGWAYEGANGVDLSGMAAWFRRFLMGDTAQRKRFFGDNCTLCSDTRVKVYRNSLMTRSRGARPGRRPLDNRGRGALATTTPRHKCPISVATSATLGPDRSVILRCCGPL